MHFYAGCPNGRHVDCPVYKMFTLKQDTANMPTEINSIHTANRKMCIIKGIQEMLFLTEVFAEKLLYLCSRNKQLPE